MDATLLHDKARELCKLISNPNRCYECWAIDRPLRVLTLFSKLSNGQPASCEIPVCELCRSNGAPEFRKIMAVACKYADPNQTVGEVDLEAATGFVLLAYHQGDYQRALLGQQTYVS